MYNNPSRKMRKKMSFTGKAFPFLSALALAAALGSSQAQAQTTTNLLSFTTFDSAAPSPWGYGYFYNDAGLGVQQYSTAYYLPDDVEQTNAMWQYTFDISAL